METILYKPLFINPQAYYVFPNINGRLEPKTGSGKEPAMFIGNIEVKTIAHGDIGKKQYFYNTNEIDLSAFSNSLVRISLYTNRGNIVLGEWDLDIIEGESENYIDPEILDSLCGVWIADQNTNESESRNIIKNKIVDRGGDLELQNFGYKLNSGYGKYEEDFTTWRISKSGIVSTINVNSIHITRIKEPLPDSLAFFENRTTTNRKFNIKLKISGLTSDMKCTINNQGSIIKELANGVNEISADLVAGWYGFTIIKLDGSIIGDCDVTITQIPSFEGALVTDGKDDLITSTKTVKEMLGGSSEITVVSMMANLDSSQIMCNSNFSNTNGYNVRNTLKPNGVISMLGYTDKNGTTNNLNLIMGDKNSIKLVDKVNFNSDYVFYPSSYNAYSFKTAWYWTIIANKVLTTDQINQVISYFNLDKHVKPDIIYDTIRQGITNENHASFNDELVDFSGNGHNMKLYNLNWDKQSGIGSYPFSFKDYNYFSDRADVSVNKSNFVLTANFDSNNFLEINTKNTEVPSFKIKAEGIDTITNGRLAYRIAASDGSISVKYISEDGEYEIPGSPLTENAAHSGFYVSGGINDNVRVKVTIIPDYEGALVSDGIDDYGKVENLPIYKDYTVVADRAWTNDLVKAQCLTSKLNGDNFGSFSFELIENGFSSYSFGISNKGVITIDSNKKISYQSKYVYNSSPIISGNNVDGKDLFLFRNRDSYPYYAEAAIWSYILFPYSLSEFLLERQLKRYKLGTLYPNMVEFRPVIKSNASYDNIVFYYKNEKVENGTYFTAGSSIDMHIRLSSNPVNEIKAITVNGVPATFTYHNTNNNIYIYNFNLTSKSPQKINITIDEYIRYEDIVQPYPAIINLKQDGKTITWGDKLKVGSDIVFVGSANLLPELYTVSETRYNGVTLYPNTIIKVEKSMVFDNARTYLKANEPSCILSPNRLRIPNSSYKILGYIPDLTGKGNHGRLNNFAYTEESGANEDGSIRFDGKDDRITIPTLAHGSKCMLMKVNWNKDALMLYDQRRDDNPNSFAIYIPNFNNEDSIAYSSRNDGKTYIDGVLNTSVKGSQLKDVTHNITITNSNSNNDNTVSPAIGSNAKYNAFYAQMALFDFMLFPEISSEDEIKELNNIIGVEGNTDDLLTKINI